MRRTLLIASVTISAGLVAWACGGKGGSTKFCEEADLVCGSDMNLYCKGFMPTNVKPIGMGCCNYGSPIANLGDAGLSFDDAGNPVFTVGDGGKPDTGRRTISGRPPLGDCGDGGWPYDVDAGWFWSLFDAGRLAPPGKDDAGVVRIYQCYIDVCHPPEYSWDGGPYYEGGGLWWLFPDGGPRSNCGPTGCQ